jgi:E3 SUMO-protein ligase PIAS1
MRIQVEYEQQKLRNTVSTPMQSLIVQFLNDRPEFDRRVAAEVERYDKVQFEKDQARQQRHRQAQQEAQEREAAARQTIAVNAAAAAANAAVVAANVAATVAAASFPTAPTFSSVPITIPRCDFFARTQSMEIDNDVEASNATISLTDPVSLTPISTPVKAVGCKHINCFDLEAHKTRFHGRPNSDWKCGICNAHAPLYELRVDTWTEALLAKSGPDTKFVEYEAKTGAFVRALSEKANGKRKRSDDAIDVESIRAGSSSAPIEVDSD